MSIKIISCHPIFNENAVVLSKKFNWLLENEFNPEPGDLYIVYGAHEMSHQLLECQFRKNSCYGYIIMNSEQIHSQFFKNKYYIEMMKRNVVFDYNTIIADYLKKKNILTIEPVIVDPTYLYVKPSLTVKYNPDLTSDAAGTIATSIKNALINYETNRLGLFGQN